MSSFIRKGKKSRNELRLPALHYIAADQWIDEIGVKAFRAWLKLHSWVDRRDENRKYDRIPYTLESTADKLGIKSIATLYNTILKPLWEHELIDIVEYTDTKRKSQAPKNIIVYESPRNEYQSAIEPLKKTRDWKKDYGSSSQLHGRKGGRPRKEEQQEETPAVALKSTYPLKNNRVVLYPLKINRVHPLKNNRVTLLKIKGNNVFNNLLTFSNKLNNVSNNHHLEESADKKETPAVEPKEKHDDDSFYKNFRGFFTSQKGEDIKRHDIHYPVFKQLEESMGYPKIIELASKYIASGKDDIPQIAWFLKGGYQNYITTDNRSQAPRKKMNDEKIPSALINQLEQGQKEVAATVEEVTPNDDWRSKLEEWNKQKRSNQ